MREKLNSRRRGNTGSESGATVRNSKVAPHSNAESVCVAPHSDAESFRRSRAFACIRGLLSCILCLSWFASYAAVSPHPNIMWEGGGAFKSYNIEISTDAEFKNVVDRDTIANISRYVPEKPLKPGTYYWRVNDQFNGSFEIDVPRSEIVIPAGSGMAEIRAALASAKTNESTCIRFEPGEYHLHPGEDGTVFELRDISNLIVDGGGAKFIIHDIARLVEIRGGRHITFRNFSVDYEVPLYTAAKVESVATDGTLELSLYPGCVPPETVPRFMEEKRGLFYEPEFSRIAENVFLLVYMKEAWKPLGGGRYSLQAAQPGEVKSVRPGMVYICAPRYKPQGIELYNCTDVTFVDITTYYLPGIGVVTAFAHDLKLIRLNMLRRGDRLLGIQNGGTNIHNARIGPWIEGCRFENTGDDCNHISALVLSPVAQPKSDTVVISPLQPGTRGLTAHDLDVQIGDRLAFFDRPSGTLKAEARVVGTQVSGRNLTVQMDRELPEFILHTGQGGFPALEAIQIYNLDRACGNFAFRNNDFVRGRRTGILAKSGPGLIENNRFEELGGGGVELFNAPFEGLHAHDILIQNNLFRRGGLVFKKMGAAPAVWTQMFSGEPSQPLHRNIRIINNRIEDYQGHGMDIRDAEDVVIEGNVFVNKELKTVRESGAFLINLSGAENVSIQNNRFEDTRFNRSREINGAPHAVRP